MLGDCFCTLLGLCSESFLDLCGTRSRLVHNFNLLHSGEGSAAYGDDTGNMVRRIAYILPFIMYSLYLAQFSNLLNFNFIIIREPQRPRILMMVD